MIKLATEGSTSRRNKMEDCVADPSTTARWSAARQSEKIIPKWSLRQSCLSTVKDSILGYSRGRNCLDFDSKDHNPFLEYPMNLRQELLLQLLRLKPTGRELLKAAELLVCSGITSFDLSYLDDCRFTDVQTVLRLLTRTGSCLKELVLAGQWLYNKNSALLVRDLLESVPNLERLRLQHTTKGGDELKMVLANCVKLKKLEIMHPSVDEEEIESLVDEIERTQSAKYDCAKKNLVEIKLPSSINGKSVLRILETFPNLKHISCTYLDQVVDELEEAKDLERWRGITSKIAGIQATLPVSADTIGMMVEWFPNLEEVSLEIQEDMDMQPLADLPNLRSLELKNSPTLPSSYIEEVLPLLNACGKSLSSLSLERFDIVDLAKTATYCPNLLSFSCQWFTLLGTSISRGAKRPFLNLRYLRLRPRVNRKVTPEACEILLTNSTSLHHLEFYCSYGLTDTLVNKLVKTNKFSHLRTLLLRHGHGLSSAGVLQLTKCAERLTAWDVGMVSTKQATPST